MGHMALDGSGGTFTYEALAQLKAEGTLRHYWQFGEGAAKIRWGTPGDFTRCVRHLNDPDKGLGSERAKRICAQWHHDMTGLWPGDRRNV